MYYNQKDGCNPDGITTEFWHFFPWQRTYGLHFMLWRTTNYWPPNDGRAMFNAEKALLKVPSGTQCSAVQVFLGTGADYQTGSVCSSDCFGNVSNISQNGRLMREEDRASCWAMAITNFLLNVSYRCLRAQLSEWNGKRTHPLHNFPGDTSLLCWELRHIPTARSCFSSQLCWKLFPAPPVASEECWSTSVSFLLFFPSTYRIFNFLPIFFFLIAGRKNGR